MKQKSFFALLLVLVFVAAPAASAVTVDCDGWWDGFDCQPWELQDEFDEVDDQITSLEEGVEENAEDIDGLESSLHFNYMIDGGQQFQIWGLKGDVNSLESTIAEHSEEWSTDGRGTSFGRVVNYLFGDYLDFLRSLFAPLDDVLLLHAKLDIIVDDYGVVFDENDVITRAAAKKMVLTGSEEVEVDGWICTPTGCVKTVE